MPLSFVFWVLMLVWFVFGLYFNRDGLRSGNYHTTGGNLLLFVLLFILGWRVFGFVLQG